MILNRHVFRKIKTTLMTIEGNPGSARLSEALARGFGFDDYHALKARFELQDRSLAYSPESTGIDHLMLLEALTDLDQEVAKNIAATTLFLFEGSFFMEDLASVPELKGARVILINHVPDAWAREASTYIDQSFETFDQVSFAFTPDDFLWNAVDTDLSPDFDSFRILRGGGYDTVKMSQEIIDKMDAFENAGHLAMNIFIECSFLRICDTIPEKGRDSFKYLIVDRRGIRGVVGDFETSMEVWYLEVPQND